MSDGSSVDFVMVSKLGNPYVGQPEQLQEEVIAWLEEHEDGGDHNTAEPVAKRHAILRHAFESRLVKRRGVILEHELSDEGDVVYAKVHIPFEICKNRAQYMQLRKPLLDLEGGYDADGSFLVKHLQRLSSLSTIATVTVSPEPDTDIEHFERKARKSGLLRKTGAWIAQIWSPIEIPSTSGLYRVNQHNMFQNAEDPSQFFSSLERSTIAHSILAHTRYDQTHRKPEHGGRESVWLVNEEMTAGYLDLIHLGVYTAAFPLHDGPLHITIEEIKKDELWKHSKRIQLLKTWATMKHVLATQPLNLLKHYLGSEITWYFAWMGYYTAMLFPLALISIVCFTLGVVESLPEIDIWPENNFICEGNETKLCDGPNSNVTKGVLSEECYGEWRFSKISSGYGALTMGIVTPLWAVLFALLWRRRTAQLQFSWSEKEIDNFIAPARPGFKGTYLKQNPITQLTEHHVEFGFRLKKYLMTYSGVCFVFFVVIANFVGVLFFKIYLQTFGDHLGLLIAGSLLKVILILIFKKIYEVIAKSLTETENHRTSQRFANSFQLKMIVFEFINNYASLFYIAFFLSGTFHDSTTPDRHVIGTYVCHQDSGECNSCPVQGCMFLLAQELITLTIGKALILNIAQQFYPLIDVFLNERKVMDKKSWCNWLASFNPIRVYRVYKKKQRHHEKRPWEREFDELAKCFKFWNEYLEMAVLFGFTVLFVSAMPLIPVVTLISNLREVRGDAKKFLLSYRRMPSEPMVGIGMWHDVILTFALLSVVTNGFILAFTSDIVESLVWQSSKDTTAEGYASFKFSSFRTSPNHDVCYFHGFREDFDPEDKTEDYWKVLFSKVAFFAIYEHVMAAICLIMIYLIPPVPRAVKKLSLRNEYVSSVLQGTREMFDTDGHNDEKIREHLDSLKQSLTVIGLQHGKKSSSHHGVSQFAENMFNNKDPRHTASDTDKASIHKRNVKNSSSIDISSNLRVSSI